MNNNRSTFIVDIATVVVLALIVIVLLARFFIGGSKTSPNGPGGGAYTGSTSAYMQVISSTMPERTIAFAALPGTLGAS